MKRAFRFIILALAFTIVLGIIWVNARLYSLPDGVATAGEVAEDAPAQLANIGRRLRAGEGEAMQRIFPEGWFFSHALYGFAWVNVGKQTGDPSLKDQAVAEVRWVLRQMETPQGLGPFQLSTQVPHGVFYLGWRNRLLGGLLSILPESARAATEIEEFRSNSEALAEAFRKSPTVHLDAYPGQAWPCDNVMALASLRLHDDLFGERYGEVVAAWLEFTRKHLDPSTGLIVHQIDAGTGAMLTPARSSTQVYMHALLPEISPDFAREQYGKFRQLYVEDWLGFLPVREYPKGTSGKGDIDTGPLIFGISPSATVVSIAAARANGDYELAERTAILSEIVGVPWTSDGEKSYGFGQIVVADAFLVWGKTLVPWSKVPPQTFPPSTPSWWRVRIHVISALVVLSVMLVAIRLRNKFRVSSRRDGKSCGQ